MKRQLITADWCGACSEVKKALKAKGISYKEVDIDSAAGKALDKKHNIKTLPTMIIDGKVVNDTKKWK